MQKKVKHTAVQGALILVVATVIVKIIGALYKIPLSNMLGGYGQGFYSLAYDIYIPMYTIAMAGLPIAVAKMVAEYNTKKKHADVNTIFKVAKKIFWVTGIVSFVLMLIISYLYLRVILNVSRGDMIFNLPVFYFLAPALVFCCIGAAYRGYYEGLRNMYPTGISLILESLPKLFVGLFLVYITQQIAVKQFVENIHFSGQNCYTTVMMQSIKIQDFTTINAAVVEYSEQITHAAAPFLAAAAIIGITFGSILSAIFLIIYDKTKGKKVRNASAIESEKTLNSKQVVKMLSMFAVPIVIASLINSMSSFIDMFTINNRLQVALERDYYTIVNQYKNSLGEYLSNFEISKTLYGVYTGFAYSLYHFIPSICIILSLSALPAVSALFAKQDSKKLNMAIESLIRITAIFAIPAGICLSILAKPILVTLYFNKVDDALIAVNLIRVLGIAAIFTSLNAPLIIVLQGIGKTKLPLFSMIIGLFIKIGVNYFLIAIPSINILGASIGTLCCFSTIFVLNLYFVCKYTKLKFNFYKILFKPLFATSLCVVSAFLTYDVLSRVLTNRTNSGFISLGCAIVVGVIFYLIITFLLQTITKNDILYIPKGKKIYETLEKLNWIG